jgi:hypothetical protein
VCALAGRSISPAATVFIDTVIDYCPTVSLLRFKKTGGLSWIESLFYSCLLSASLYGVREWKSRKRGRHHGYSTKTVGD